MQPFYLARLHDLSQKSNDPRAYQGRCTKSVELVGDKDELLCLIMLASTMGGPKLQHQGDIVNRQQEEGRGRGEDQRDLSRRRGRVEERWSFSGASRTSFPSPYPVKNGVRTVQHTNKLPAVIPDGW